jgi:RNase H-like domain found in reverse transcriptase
MVYLVFDRRLYPQPTIPYLVSLTRPSHTSQIYLSPSRGGLSAPEKAFETLKKHFTEEPVLMMPDHTKPFQIECDASKYASGAVLTQLDANGDRHPCAFISKTFSPTERNYKIYDRELLAIIRALDEWRHYIQGSPHTTTILPITKI